MLETIVLSAAMALGGVVDLAKVAPKVAPGTLPAAALTKDAKHPVIVHIVSRDQTLTVKAGERGLLYSLTSKEGKVLMADASAEKFAQEQPAMFRAVRQYIAVQADASSAVGSASLDYAAVDMRE